METIFFNDLAPWVDVISNAFTVCMLAEPIGLRFSILWLFETGPVIFKKNIADAQKSHGDRTLPSIEEIRYRVFDDGTYYLVPGARAMPLGYFDFMMPVKGTLSGTADQRVIKGRINLTYALAPVAGVLNGLFGSLRNSSPISELSSYPTVISLVVGSAFLFAWFYHQSQRFILAAIALEKHVEEAVQ